MQFSNTTMLTFLVTTPYTFQSCQQHCRIHLKQEVIKYTYNTGNYELKYMFTNLRICSCQNYNVGGDQKQLTEKRWEGGVIEQALMQQLFAEFEIPAGNMTQFYASRAGRLAKRIGTLVGSFPPARDVHSRFIPICLCISRAPYAVLYFPRASRVRAIASQS